MKTDRKERDILKKAFDAFQEKTGLTATTEFEPETDKGVNKTDAKARLIWNDLELNFAVEIKKTVTRATIGGIVMHLRKLQDNGLLVTRYITPQIAEQLKELDINFIDTVGNAYIYHPPLFVLIKGNKPVDDDLKIKPTRAFQTKGMQVVFALLCNPGLENAPYREIALKADVALGTVNWVMTDLRQRGYLVDIKNRIRRLIKKEDLLTRWVAAYPERLRPKKLIGVYIPDSMDWWKTTGLANFEAYWGGEVAAANFTKYLKPQMVTIYTKDNLGELMLKHKFKKNAEGTVEILRVFWNFNNAWQQPEGNHRDVVHPILIYTDLMATGDKRNIETAEIIYEKEIVRFVREN